MSGDHESSSRFPRLNDTNYPEWALRMEAELIRKGYWSVVEITVDTEGKEPAEVAKELDTKVSKRNAQKMAEARAEMILRVDDGQLSHMRSRDPMEIWNDLRDVHRARGFATSLALRRKFLTAKKKDEQSMQSWIGEIRSQAFTIEEVTGTVVSDQDKILALTMGLPPAYDPVIINFDSASPDSLTFNTVVSRLLNEETRQHSGITGTNPEVKGEREASFTATAGRPSRSDVTCHFCDKKGHYKSECREKMKWDESQEKKKDQANVAVEFDAVW